jgi:hypothetical protein
MYLYIATEADGTEYLETSQESLPHSLAPGWGTRLLLSNSASPADARDALARFPRAIFDGGVRDLASSSPLLPTLPEGACTAGL